MAKRILFFCTGNSARSQMAEAFARAYGGATVEAFSAGTEPKVLNPLRGPALTDIANPRL